MRTTFYNSIAFLITINFGLYASGQELVAVDVDLSHIYNDWTFSALESKGELLIYREEGDFFVNNARNKARPSFKFSKGDNVFFLSYHDGKIYRRCGNDHRKSTSPKWKKGIWELIEKENQVELVLKYFTAEKGKKYKLDSHVVYEILHLEEDKMILRKLESDI